MIECVYGGHLWNVLQLNKFSLFAFNKRFPISIDELNAFHLIHIYMIKKLQLVWFDAELMIKLKLFFQMKLHFFFLF